MSEEFGKIWRDGSPPAFTAEHPEGTHSAWYFTRNRDGRQFGPYFERQHAEIVMDFFKKMAEAGDEPDA